MGIDKTCARGLAARFRLWSPGAGFRAREDGIVGVIKDAEAAREQEVAAWFGERAENTIETSCARVSMTSRAGL